MACLPLLLHICKRSSCESIKIKRDEGCVTDGNNKNMLDIKFYKQERGCKMYVSEKFEFEKLFESKSEFEFRL